MNSFTGKDETTLQHDMAMACFWKAFFCNQRSMLCAAGTFRWPRRMPLCDSPRRWPSTFQDGDGERDICYISTTIPLPLVWLQQQQQQQQKQQQQQQQQLLLPLLLLLLLLPTTTTTTTYYYLLLPTTTYILPTTTYYYLLLPTTTYYYLLLPTTTYYYLLLPILPTTTTTTTTSTFYFYFYFYSFCCYSFCCYYNHLNLKEVSHGFPKPFRLAERLAPWLQRLTRRSILDSPTPEKFSLCPTRSCFNMFQLHPHHHHHHHHHLHQLLSLRPKSKPSTTLKWHMGLPRPRLPVGCPDVSGLSEKGAVGWVVFHRGFSVMSHPIWQCRLGTLLARATQFWGWWTKHGKDAVGFLYHRCDGYMCWWVFEEKGLCCVFRAKDVKMWW